MAPRGGVTDHNAAMNNKAETTWRHIKGTASRGAVEIEVNGAPEAMGYCHCNIAGPGRLLGECSRSPCGSRNASPGTGLVGHFVKPA